ncbi:hypothetical protein Tco_0786718 [Tanacetum coccineum]
MANLRYSDKHNMVAFLKKPTESVGFTEIVDFIKGTSLRYALTHNPTIYDSLVKQFWQTATVRSLANGIQELVASIDNKEYTITEASVRNKLQLADATGISNLSDAKIYEGLTTLGYVSEGKLTFWKKNFTPQWKFLIHTILHCLSSKSGGWDQFGSPIATALIFPSISQPPIPSTTEPPHSSPLRQIDRQDTEIPQSQCPTITHVEDEATTTRVGVETKGATTTTSGLDAGLDSGNIHESPLRSHEAPLNEGHTLGSAEDSLQLKELMVLVPKLVTRIDNLEKELHHIKNTYGKAVFTLVERVKSLEVPLKRKTKKVVVSDSEYEETENQRRKIQDIDDDPLVSLVRESMKEADFVTPTKDSALGTYKRRVRSTDKGKDISTGLDAEAEVNTGSEDFNPNSIEVTTCSAPVSTPTEIPEATQCYTEEDWDTIKAKLEANAELIKSLQGESVSDDDFVKRMVEMINQKKKYYAEQKAKAKRSKPMTQAHQRYYMSTFIKNQSSWKLTQLKKLTFEELKIEFEKMVKSIKRFVPMEIEKRVKRQGTAQDEIEEEREAFMKDKVTSASSESEIGIDAIPTAIKPPSIVDWKIIPQTGQKVVYEIIRSDGSYKVYMSLGAILKYFSRDDLTGLYRLVIKKYGANTPKEMYDRVLWGDLKTTFDLPLSDDVIWGLPLQQKMINWR